MGVGGGVGENLLPTDKNRKGTNLLKCPTSKRWGGGGGGFGVGVRIDVR